jgi:hypothetical protein
MTCCFCRLYRSGVSFAVDKIFAEFFAVAYSRVFAPLKPTKVAKSIPCIGPFFAYLAKSIPCIGIAFAFQRHSQLSPFKGVSLPGVHGQLSIGLQKDKHFVVSFRAVSSTLRLEILQQIGLCIVSKLNVERKSR